MILIARTRRKPCSRKYFVEHPSRFSYLRTFYLLFDVLKNPLRRRFGMFDSFSGGLVRNLIFTLYKNAFDTFGNTIEKSWDSWKEILSEHQVRGNLSDTSNKARLDRAKNGPAIVLGEIANGKTRKSANVRAIHALALDIEDLPDDVIQKSLDKLSSYQYLIYTTHKHGSVVAGERARLRVILPLENPILPSEHASAWAGLNSLVGNINDPSTRDVARLHFLPSTFNPDFAWTLSNSGKWISLDDLPDLEKETYDHRFESLNQEEALSSIRHKMRLMPKTDELKEAVSKLLIGEVFAEEGERHKTILGITMWMASKDRTLDHNSIRRLFASSLEVMEITATGAPTLQEVIRAYDGAVEKLNEFDKKKKQEFKRKATEFQLKQAGEKKGPYTKDELEQIANRNSWSVEDLKDKWIIQRDGTGWFLTESGDYAGPYSKEDTPLAASRFLARAPIRLVDATKSGFRYRSTNEVVREAGSLVDRILSDMTIQRTFFDPITRTMHEAILPLRAELSAKYDSEIDRWLQLAGGPLYPKLVDWMTCCVDLNKLLCAIYLDGPKGSGKTMLAHGLAKLWTDGPPAELESVLSDFNDEIARCPMIIADEEIPKKYRQTVTTQLRSMLSTTSRTLRRKYRPTSEIRGAIRLILTANNEFLLDSRDVSSAQDLEAIAQRFLYVLVPQEATDYLDNLPRNKKEMWWKEGLARHALWLSENHKIESPGKRFWVEGDISQMHRLLMTGSRWNSMVCEWLVRYLLNPDPFESQGTGLIRILDDELLVNDQALVDGWNLYIQLKQEPETAKIGAALRAISKTSRRKQIRWQGARIRYRVIDVDHLISWSDRYNIGDKDILLARVSGNLKEGENVVHLDTRTSVDFDHVFGGKEQEEDE